MDIKGFKGRDGNVYQYDYGSLANVPESEGTPGQGADGGYYTPSVTQLDEDTIQFAFTGSKPDMPAVEPVTVELPAGQNSGGNVAYDEAQNLTEEQKAQARDNIGAQPAGNYLTEVPNGYAKTDDIPTEQEIIQLIERHAPESSGGGIAVTGATVGQTVKISAVDENGVPTAWEAVDFPSSGGGDSDGTAVLELIVDHTVTAEEAQATSITFTKEAYPLIAGQKFLYLRMVKPTGANGWWSLRAGKVEVINGDGSQNTIYTGFSMVVQGFWMQAFYEGSNSALTNRLVPSFVSPGTAHTAPTRNLPYANYDSLTLASYTKIFPEGTTIEIYGGRFV